MKNGQTRPKINKRFLLSHDGQDIYAVDPLGVRDKSQTDEEFGNFALHQDFPRLIPKGEIWISDRLVDREGVFFIANALMRLREIESGADDGRAYTAGENLERFLRERLTGLEYRGGKPNKRVPEPIYLEEYATIPDVKGPVTVWLIDGNQVRSRYKTDYTEGGHGYVYAWVPKDEIWVERVLERSELPFIVAHEYLELRLMRDRKLEYDEAHTICSKVEYKLRADEGTRGLLSARRTLTKADVPRLADPEFFAQVVRRYVEQKRKA